MSQTHYKDLIINLNKRALALPRSENSRVILYVSRREFRFLLEAIIIAHEKMYGDKPGSKDYLDRTDIIPLSFDYGYWKDNFGVEVTPVSVTCVIGELESLIDDRRS